MRGAREADAHSLALGACSDGRSGKVALAERAVAAREVVDHEREAFFAEAHVDIVLALFQIDVLRNRPAAMWGPVPCVLSAQDLEQEMRAAETSASTCAGRRKLWCALEHRNIIAAEVHAREAPSLWWHQARGLGQLFQRRVHCAVAACAKVLDAGGADPQRLLKVPLHCAGLRLRARYAQEQSCDTAHDSSLHTARRCRDCKASKTCVHWSTMVDAQSHMAWAPTNCCTDA